MEARQQKAIAIAIASNVSPNGDTWIIPSQTSGKKYTVTLNCESSNHLQKSLTLSLPLV
jgi:hypothetical protein